MRRLVGERLPALRLPAATGDGRVRLRPRGRDASVLLLFEGPGHEPSDLRPYLAALTASVPEMRRWDGRLLLVADGGPPEPLSVPPDRGRPPGQSRPGLSLLIDEARTLRRRLGLEEAGTVLLIADRWGEIYHAAARAGSASDPSSGEPPPDEGAETPAEAAPLPSPAAIIEWLKYLTTQCPECGVIDAPGYGAWASE